MKLDETTPDEAKENTCNGIKNLPSSSDDGNDGDSAGVGDLLVEDTNASRHEEEPAYQNGCRGDDSTSVSSSSSNFPIPEDLSDEEEITLRLSDDEDLPTPATNESDNKCFTSSLKDGSTEKVTSVDGGNNSDTDTELLKNMTGEKGKYSESEVISETNDSAEKVGVSAENADVSAENADVSAENADVSAENVEASPEKPDSSTEMLETSPEKPDSSTEIHEESPEKSDDNLDNLISDLNEQSKSALKSENKKVTVSDLRQEIEDLIRSNDSDENKENNYSILDESTTEEKTAVPETKSDKETSEAMETNEDESENEEEIVENEETENDHEMDDDFENEIGTSKIGKEDDLEPNNDSDFSDMEVETKESQLEETETNTEVSDPAAEISEPVAEISEPVAEISEPVAEISEPVAEISQPVAEISEPVAEISEPTAEIEEPAAEISESAAEIVEPAAEIAEITEPLAEITGPIAEPTTETNVEDTPEKVTEDITETDEDIEETLVETETKTAENILSDSEKSEPEMHDKQSEMLDKQSETHGKQPEIDLETPKTDKPVEETKKEVSMDADSEVNKKAGSNAILIDDDVEMKDDFNEETKEGSEENKLNEDVDPFDLLKEDVTKKPDVQPLITEELKGEKISRKRSLDSDETTSEVKKPKINGTIKKNIDPEKQFNLQHFRDFMAKKKITKLTRAELEQLCLQKMCEAITQASQVGDLNRKIIKHETTIESYRNKFANINKQIRDLEVVHSRVLQEVRNTGKDNTSHITPVKITRSVGLQVTLQAIAARGAQQPLLVAPGGLKRKHPQRASLPNKFQTSPPRAMPPPVKAPVRSPNQGKGIKTILPKVYPPAEPKEPNPSLLENYLQTPGAKAPSPPVRKSAPGGGASTSGTPSASTAKVIDLTDEDDVQKTATTAGIRVVSSQQLTATTPVTTATLPRLTYLVQGSQAGQQVLLATSNAATRPGGVRSTLMFKPVPPGQVPPGQRLNIVRQNIPGVVLPTSSSSAVRPGQQVRFTSPASRPQVRNSAPVRHPAPLPGPPNVQPSQPNWKAMPPKPTLKISRAGDGLVLSWRMQTNKDMSLYEDIGSYQLYAYQETSGPPSTDMWRKVGDVKALALPMACTLTQFTDGNKYHFAVRAVDVKSRVGPFSQPEQIALP